MRKIAGFVTERRIESLLVQWIRIINRTSTFSFAQEFLKGIALLDSNGVLVVDVFESFRRERRHDAGNLREEPVVFRGVRLAGALPIRKVAEFYSQNRRVDLAGAAVSAGLAVGIFFGLPPGPQGSPARPQLPGILHPPSPAAAPAPAFLGVQT